jgi:hypothetical protein
MIKEQRRELGAGVAYCTAKVPTNANSEEFAYLKRNISHEALRLLKKQLDLALSEKYDTSKACSRAFTTKFGLPYKHFIHDKIHELRSYKGESAMFYTKLQRID